MNSETERGKGGAEMPKQVAEGTLDFGGVELRVIVLDNGQRLIHAEDFEKYVLPFINACSEIDEGDLLDDFDLNYGCSKD